MDPNPDKLPHLIGRRAQNLYLTKQLLCSEAVVAALNKALRGGVDEQTAIATASAFPEGFDGRGCLCGALAGAVLGLGLFLGRRRPGARDKERARPAAGQLHDRFKERFGATCCRALSRKVKDNPRLHFRQCAELTGAAAEMAAAILLERRPELAGRADWEYLSGEDSRLGAAFKRAANYVAIGRSQGA